MIMTCAWAWKAELNLPGAEEEKAGGRAKVKALRWERPVARSGGRGGGGKIKLEKGVEP